MTSGRSKLRGLLSLIFITRCISKKFLMANNFKHHGRRACESRHFWYLDFITHRIQITEKTVKIRLTLLNFVLSLRKSIIFQKCRNRIWNRHLRGCLRAMLRTVCRRFHCSPRFWKFHTYFIRSAILPSTISDEVPRQNSRLHWKAVPRSSCRNLNQLSTHQSKFRRQKYDPQTIHRCSHHDRKTGKTLMIS